ncbi:hypothetical protein A2716_03030 [candidate division WWE3 bacterium RIFCSPHIGHO2_01_FULL_40_23]|uniref:Peptidase A2 domain-containing protein n=1 Tax=candidate division WWE3 bacterium RIFCSPLOWO2_01_FULL_41_18 TaxID=1802625 RepID=A0A1F4VCA5_UNCKA|nr:MAG: hypothetical protein A2716_03030 [candidate division WWE3 bacterium RIFCSPHIGHO2_01_FULL_40_23]OGC54804.1 MAG: hypothetical protein A3A78_04985 [candidate division WWE3 bacterium RIFCSPLOWO2_01_FULL_41_18]
MRSKIKLTPDYYRSPETGKELIVYAPRIILLVFSNHKTGPATTCYLDTGATFNIFPWDYALKHLGFSESSIRKGVHIKILGVGNAIKEGYGHTCAFHHPDFRIENAMVYFVKDQPYPLLGLIGFVDKFDKVVLNEKDKVIELIKD